MMTANIATIIERPTGQVADILAYDQYGILLRWVNCYTWEVRHHWQDMHNKTWWHIPWL